MASQYSYLIEKAIAKSKRPDISDACIYDTVFAHNQIDFEEPAGSGHWRTYSRYFWSRHAALVSHDPEKLVEEHVKWYVDPATKKINLNFWFELPSGIVYSMAPTREFYELEKEYFEQHHLCSSHPEDFEPHHEENSPGPEYLYNQKDTSTL